jgi:hypothetical protein
MQACCFSIPYVLPAKLEPIGALSSHLGLAARTHAEGDQKLAITNELENGQQAFCWVWPYVSAFCLQNWSQLERSAPILVLHLAHMLKDTIVECQSFKSTFSIAQPFMMRIKVSCFYTWWCFEIVEQKFRFQLPMSLDMPSQDACEWTFTYFWQVVLHVRCHGKKSKIWYIAVCSNVARWCKHWLTMLFSLLHGIYNIGSQRSSMHTQD